MEQKIKEALKKIKIDKNGNWYVPNRKMLNMTMEEFIEFERARIKEFEDEQIRENKYRYHYDGYSIEEKNKVLLFLSKKKI